MCNEQKPCLGHENHLCKLVSQGLPDSDPKRYHGLVRDPGFVCKSCGRVAAKNNNLCDPVQLGTFE